MFSSHVVEAMAKIEGRARRIGLVIPELSRKQCLNLMVPVTFYPKYESSQNYFLVHVDQLKRRFSIGDLVTILTDHSSDKCGEIIGVPVADDDQTYQVRAHWGGGGTCKVHVDRLLNIAPCLVEGCLNGVRHRDGILPRQGDDVIFRDGRTGIIFLVGNHVFYLINQLDGSFFMAFPGDFQVLKVEQETAVYAEKEKEKEKEKDNHHQPKKSEEVEPVLPVSDASNSDNQSKLSRNAKKRKRAKERSAASGDKTTESIDETCKDGAENVDSSCSSIVAVNKDESVQTTKGDPEPAPAEPVTKNESELRQWVDSLLLLSEEKTMISQSSKNSLSSIVTEAIYEIVRSNISPVVKLELLTKLLESNLKSYVNINALHGVGANTALHIAARNGDIKIVTFLLEQGASPLLPNGVGVLPEGKGNSMVALLRSARKTAKDAAKKAEKNRRMQLQMTTLEQLASEIAVPSDAAKEGTDNVAAELLSRDGEDLRQHSAARSLQQLVLQAVESLTRQSAAQAPAPVPVVADSSTPAGLMGSVVVVDRAVDRQKKWTPAFVSDPAEIDLEEHDMVDDIAAANDNIVETKMEGTMELLLDGSSSSSNSSGSLIEESVWEMEMTKEARHQWFQLHTPLRQMVADKLNELAQGRWSNLVRPTSHVTDLRLFRTNFSKGGRVIWEKAIAYSSKLCCYCEVIRIWAIVVDHEKQAACIRSIEESHRKGRTSKTLKHMRPVIKQGGSLSASDREGVCITLPRCFEEENSEATSTTSLSLVTGDDAPRLWYPPAVPSPDSYVLLKFYQCTKGLLRRYCAELDEDASLVDFPFRLSPTEHAVCDLHPTPSSSVLLLGRSGTGKTTCLGFRMWFHYKAWYERFRSSRLLSDCTQNLNQVFLTANPVLRSEVRKFFHNLLRGETGGGAEAGTVISQSSIDNKLSCGLDSPTLSNLHSSRFPLFLTKREWLVLLDGTLKRPFFPRLPGPGAELTSHSASYAWGRADHSALSGLSDCFYDDDSEEEDYAADNTEPGDECSSVFDSVDGDGSSSGVYSRITRPTKRIEIDYDYFERELWRMIPGAREYSASLLWCEFTSFIKGSAESLESGCLSESQYSEIGKKRAPNFTGSRPLVYSLFLEYERLRKRIGGFDICDIVYHIYHELQLQALSDREMGGSGNSRRRNGYHGTPLHEVYVDEVQDFLGAEIMLLLAVADPNNLFLTGDDAQTIARGLSFRFSDIRSLFWKQNQFHSSIGVPQIFKLTNNYRTHSGILNLANAVIDLIWHFFPGSVDKLPPDRGLFDGPKPWLLHAATFDDLCLLLLGSDRDSQIEFGANQCVIVRDSASKDIIPEEIRRGGIVCSVFESKGLEFNDVLLYNFFTDSPAKSMWRCVLGAMDVLQREEHLDQDKEDSLIGMAAVSLSESLSLSQSVHATSSSNKEPRSAPLTAGASSHKTKGAARPLEFDERQHKILLDELRHLYTAITRARVNIWIYDESEELREPMFEFFRRNDLVRVVKSVLELDELKITKGALTSQEEWITQGRNLESKGAYHLAHICFKKGKEDLLATRSLAQALARGQTTALDGIASSTAESSLLVGQRGKLPNNAVESPQMSMQRYRRAGELFLLSRPADCKTVDGLAEAASCFKRGGEIELAVQLYKAMGNVKLAAKCLDVAERFYQAGVLYVELGKLAAAVRCFSKCSESKIEFIEGAKLLARNNYIDEAVKLLLTYREFSEAIDMVQSSSSIIKVSKSPEDIAILALKDAVVRNKGDIECLHWMQRMESSSHPRVEQTLRDLRATTTLAHFFIRCQNKVIEGVTILVEKKQFLKAAEFLGLVDCENEGTKKTVLRLQARCFAAAKKPLLAENTYSVASDTENAALIRIERLSASFRTAAHSTTSDATPPHQAEIATQIITDLRHFLQLKHGWGVFWILYNAFHSGSLQALFPSTDPTKVELLLRALKIVNDFSKKISSTYRKATKDFFEFEDSTFRPGYVRYDKLAIRLQTFLYGRLTEEAESPASLFYLCHLSHDIFALITNKVIKHIFKDWQLETYLRSTIGSHRISPDDDGGKRLTSSMLLERFKVCNELISTLRDFGYTIKDAEKTSKTLSSCSVLPDEWREGNSLTSTFLRVYRQLVQKDLVKSLVDYIRSLVVVVPEEERSSTGGPSNRPVMTIPLREGLLKLPANCVCLLQEYLNEVLFGRNHTKLSITEISGKPDALTEAIILITLSDIATMNDDISWMQVDSHKTQSSVVPTSVGSVTMANIANTPIVNWFRTFLNSSGWTSKKQSCYILRRTELICEFIMSICVCERVSSPTPIPPSRISGKEDIISPMKPLGYYSLKDPLMIPLLEEIVLSALFHVTVPLTQHILIPFSLAFGLLGSATSWKKASIRIDDQIVSSLHQNHPQDWNPSLSTTTSQTYLSRLLRSCQCKLPQEIDSFQRVKLLLCHKIIPLLSSSLITVCTDIRSLKEQLELPLDDSSPSLLDTTKKLNDALFVCNELQSMVITVHMNIMLLNKLSYKDPTLFQGIVSEWISTYESVQLMLTDVDDQFPGLCNRRLREIHCNKDNNEDILFQQTDLLCLDLSSNQLLPSSDILSHMKELLRLREQVGAVQAEKDAHDLKAQEDHQKRRHQGAMEAQRIIRGFLARRKYKKLSSTSTMSNISANTEMAKYHQWFHTFFSLLMRTIGMTVYYSPYLNHPQIIFNHSNLLENWEFSTCTPQYFVAEVMQWLQSLAQAASRLQTLRENIIKYLKILDSVLTKPLSDLARSQLLSSHQGLLNDLRLIETLFNNVQILVAQPGVGFSFIRANIGSRHPEFFDISWEQKISRNVYKTATVCKAVVRESERLVAQSQSDKVVCEVASGKVDVMSAVEQHVEQQQQQALQAEDKEEEVDDDECNFDDEFTLVVSRKRNNGRASKRGYQKPITSSLSTTKTTNKKGYPAGNSARYSVAGRPDGGAQGAGARNRDKFGKNFKNESSKK